MSSQTVSHYRLLEKLGKGGMGEVYLAEDVKHGRRVALKMLSERFTRDEKSLLRFRKEANAVLKLNHPNILTVYEIGEEGERFFIATEYIKGDTLRDRFSHGEMKIDEALGVGIQVARALEAAHDEGIVHRDVKPENVMLRRDRVGRDRLVKVLDFGLAKLTEKHSTVHDPDAVTMPIHNTEPGTVMGTTGYMSPEQTRGQDVDERTDIFSLGIVLYEMIAGHPPFQGPTDSHIKVSILDQEPPPLTSAVQMVPHQLERIVRKALQKDREKRYQTITDLKTDLENLRDELDRSSQELSLTPETGAGLVSAITAHSTRSESRAPLPAEPRPVSSVEYIVTNVGRHKWAALLVVAAVALVVASIFYFRSGTTGVDAVAVLPFVNDSSDAEAEYISDGITEGIINKLSQLPNLRVMSRNAVFRYKGQKVDPQEVGRSLGVGAVLTGRVLKVGEKLVIKTELINVSDGAQLWGAEYDKDFSDIFAVQEEISRKISERLKVKLTGADEQRLSKRYTNDTEAYQLYLKGRYFWNKRDEAGLRAGIKYFREAEEKDPSYALAYSGLADSYALLCDIGAAAPNDHMPNAREAAERAIDIDPELAEGYTSRAFVKLAYDWDWRGAESDFKRALELNPRYATAHQWYASYLTQMGKYDLARREIEQAQTLDPLSPIISANSGLYLFFARKYDEAIEQYKKTLEIDPRFAVAHYYLGLAYVEKKEYDKAVEEFRTVMSGEAATGDELNADDIETAAALAYTYARAGRKAEAETVLSLMISLSKRRYVSPLYLATIYTGLGDKEQAIEQLNKAYENRHPGLVLIRVWPHFDSLRDDPRFQSLLRRFEPIP